MTFRLVDSLPRTITEALAKLAENLTETDRRLDRGYGCCWLKQPLVAQAVQDAILHFDGERYRLLAWCIMPNHVHVVVEPTGGHTLGAIVHSWKSFSAKRANSILTRSGSFWHRDYFDRFIRDEGHLARTVDYIENNPVKAGLASDPAGWPWNSTHFRS